MGRLYPGGSAASAGPIDSAWPPVNSERRAAATAREATAWEATMPTAREALLNAAMAALAALPWSAVRMVDVASAAGVSRQTLYNEFGSKEGLGRALVRRAVDEYLDGLERALASR